MEKKQKFNLYIILITVIAIISVFFLSSTFIYTHDGFVHFLRIMGTKQTITETGSFPTIIHNFCNGWGYAPNLFYNPLSTFGPVLVSIITNSYSLAIKIFIVIMMFLAGIFMSKFVKNVTKKETIGVLAGILYVTNPYYLNNLFIRGAIGEISALTFLPLLFLGLYDLFEEDGKKQYFIAIGTIGIALSHNITLFYAAIFSVIYVLFNIKKIKERPKKIIICCIIDLIFILGVTAFYILPLFLNKTNTEYAIFNNRMMWTNNDFASDKAIEIKDIFVNRVQKEGDTKNVIYKMGITTWIGLILLLINEKKVDEKYKKFLTILFGFALISIFMATKYFPWKKVPEIFCILQFPWRMLGFANFFLSFCASIGIGTVFEKIFPGKTSLHIAFITTISCLILIYLVALSGLEVEEKNDQEIEEYYSNLEEISYTQINKEYLPKKAFIHMNDYLKKREDKSVVILQGEANIVKRNKDGLKTEIEIENVNKNTILEFPYLYYLGYEATGIKPNGETVKMDTFEDDYGFVAVKINDKDLEKIIVEYKTPILYKIAYIISGVTFIIGIGVIVYTSKRNMNNCVKNRKNK